MSPHTLAYLLLIVGLFVLDRERIVQTSPALWLSVIWLSICASRPVSLWFGTPSQSASPQQYLDGSPFDRVFLGCLVVLGLIVLASRAQKVAMVLRRNPSIVIFLLYCALSILWSDYADVAFKRWIKALGALTMVLIVVSENDPLTAVKRWLTWAGFLLVPSSIILIKYYPDLGRGYNPFTWTTYYKGVATGKNELGIACLISGIAAVWRLIHLLRDRRSKTVGPSKRKIAPLIANLIFLAMILWLFSLANSMTSFSCFLMATILMILTSFRGTIRRVWLIHLLIIVMLTIPLSALFLDSASDMVQTMGRDPTLTGRTEVWRTVLLMTENPLLGTGFESFWLGPRIEKLWSIHWWHPNEAHNGYIELYLNLGWVGVALFCAIVTSGYRKALQALRQRPEEGQLRLAVLYTALVYNCTESAVGAMHPIWILLVLACLTVPGGWFRTKAREDKIILPAVSIEENTLVFESH